jgi:hypothetical protein
VPEDRNHGLTFRLKGDVMPMAHFVLGVFVGTWLGYFCMALMVMASDRRRKNERVKNGEHLQNEKDSGL